MVSEMRDFVSYFEDLAKSNASKISEYKDKLKEVADRLPDCSNKSHLAFLSKISLVVNLSSFSQLFLRPRTRGPVLNRAVREILAINPSFQLASILYVAKPKG